MFSNNLFQAEVIWSSSVLRMLEFYLGVNAFSSIATLRLTDCVFYLFVTLQDQVGLNLRLCEILLLSLCMLLLILLVINIFRPYINKRGETSTQRARFFNVCMPLENVRMSHGSEFENFSSPNYGTFAVECG